MLESVQGISFGPEKRSPGDGVEMTRLALIGAAGAAVVILAAGLIYAIGQQEDEEPADASQIETAAAENTAPESSTGEATTAATESAPQESSVANPDASAAAADDVLPSFDVVRVNPNGDAVIAGQPAQVVGPRQGKDDIVLRCWQRLPGDGCRGVDGVVARGAGDGHT